MAPMRTRVAALAGVAIGLAVAGVTVLTTTASSSGARAAVSDYLTSPTLEKIKSSGQLRACVDPEFPPEVFTKNGSPRASTSRSPRSSQRASAPPSASFRAASTA